MSNNPEQAIKNLKSVAKCNGRKEEGEKIDMKVRECAVFVLLYHLSVFIIVYEIHESLSVCIEAAGNHEERDVLRTRHPLCRGSVPHTYNEENDDLPQCCLVHVPS